MSDDLTGLLAEHEYALEMRRGSICLCGFIPSVQPETLQTQQDYHRAHLGDLIAADRERYAQQRAAEVVAAARNLIAIRMRPLVHGPAAEARAWDRLALALDAAEDAALTEDGTP